MILAVSLALAGCGTLTRPTGEITIERQQFINTWALVRVLWKEIRHNAEVACVRGPEAQIADCLLKLRDIDTRAKEINFNIEAKIAVPESEIDWAVVMELLKAMVGLIP